MSYMKIDNLYRVPELLEAYALEKIHGCVHAQSMITLDNGQEKPITHIKKGDKILSYDESSSQFVVAIVNDVIVQDKTPLLAWYSLELSNGRTLICTEDHPIKTTKGWVAAKNIKQDDEIIAVE